MVRRSPTQWHELFREQEASGLNASAFCRTRGMCPKYFSLRRRQLSDAVMLQDTTATIPVFAPVTVRRSAEAPALEVRWGTTLSLRVPIAVSPRWLVEVLHGLRD
ncbi:MAG: IS66 family insertion sequence element accessory protein TnpA [Sulfuricaulis sp.]